MAKKDVRFRLSTTDNPLDPFDDWVSWYLEDIRLGHDTCGLMARLAAVSESINDEPQLAVMRDIVKYNFSGKHIMVTREDFTNK